MFPKEKKMNILKKIAFTAMGLYVSGFYINVHALSKIQEKEFFTINSREKQDISGDKSRRLTNSIEGDGLKYTGSLQIGVDIKTISQLIGTGGAFFNTAYTIAAPDKDYNNAHTVNFYQVTSADTTAPTSSGVKIGTLTISEWTNNSAWTTASGITKSDPLRSEGMASQTGLNLKFDSFGLTLNTETKIYRLRLKFDKAQKKASMMFSASLNDNINFQLIVRAFLNANQASLADPIPYDAGKFATISPSDFLEGDGGLCNQSVAPSTVLKYMNVVCNPQDKGSRAQNSFDTVDFYILPTGTPIPGSELFSAY